MTRPHNIRIRIRIEHDVAIVRPAVEAVKAALSVKSLSFEVGGETGCEPVTLTEHFYTPSRDHLLIRPGLAPRVTRTLENLGHRVDFVDEREWPMHVRPVSEPAFSWVDPELSRAVCDADGGQLVVPACLAVEAIADLCRLYPRATVFVLVQRTADARCLWRMLQREVGEPIGLKAGNACRRERITVGTVPVAKQFDSDGNDLIVLANVSDLLGNRAREVVEHVSRGPSRLYAVVREHERLSKRDELALERLVGPVIYSDTTASWAPRVWFVPGTDTEVGRSAGDENEAAGYDDWVGQIAVALAAGDTEILQEAGMDVDEIPGPDVTVLTNTAEHAQRLGNRMSGWEIRTRRDTGTGESGRTIMTTACAARAGIRADVLVVAAGGKMNAPALLQVAGNKSNQPAAVIDVIDGQNQDWDRRHNYEETGWEVQDTERADANTARGRPHLRTTRPEAVADKPVSRKEVTVK